MTLSFILLGAIAVLFVGRLVYLGWRDTHPGDVGEIDNDLQLPHVPAWHRLIGADQADEGVPVRRLGLIDKARRQIADRNTRRPRP